MTTLQQRREKRREKSYAIDNTPTYGQFKENYHFSDGDGRRYQLAVQNGSILQSRKLQAAQRPHRGETSRCVVNSFGYITLYVRLKTGMRWFERQDLDQPLVLRDRQGEEVGVVLRQLLKVSPKRRTGTVLVSGLTQSYCNALLNQALFV